MTMGRAIVQEASPSSHLARIMSVHPLGMAITLLYLLVASGMRKIGRTLLNEDLEGGNAHG